MDRKSFLFVGALSVIMVSVFLSCKEENAKTLFSPVQAVTTLLQMHDGVVEADLALISTETNPHEFVTTAKNVELRAPGGDKVTLTQNSDGHYTASSAGNSDLVYEGGETYKYSFELTDKAEDQEVEPGDFVAVIEAPDDEVEFTWSKEPSFAGDTAKLTWKPTNRFAIVSVYGPNGELTYSTFDFTEPQFEGDKWARLKTGGSLSLSVDAFPDAGDYEVTMCAVAKKSDFDEELSADLGALSGFLAGRCVEPKKFTLGQ